MKKINAEFVRESFAGKDSIEEYSKATKNIELWDSEKTIFSKYISKDDKILDIGCGTGRTTFALSKLGYKKIIGLDISEEMLNEAKRINKERNGIIEFVNGDATNLKLEKESFDVVLFAFNGIMQIPLTKNRQKAFKEINRILKKGGIFIFTTHDMGKNKVFLQFWRDEKERWEKGEQNPRLLEFGDVIFKAGDREGFIHIPTREEVLNYLKESNFKIVEDKYRPEIYEENEEVKKFSEECRFWIVIKK